MQRTKAPDRTIAINFLKRRWLEKNQVKQIKAAPSSLVKATPGKLLRIYSGTSHRHS